MLPTDTLNSSTDQNFIANIIECNQASRIINNGGGGKRREALLINSASRLGNILREGFSNHGEWIKINCNILLQNAQIMLAHVHPIHARNPNEDTEAIIEDLNQHIGCLNETVKNADKPWYKDWRFVGAVVGFATAIGGICLYNKWSSSESAEPVYRAGGYSSGNDLGELGVLSAATTAGTIFGKKIRDKDKENLEQCWQQHLEYLEKSTSCQDKLSEILKVLQSPLKDNLTEVLNEIAREQNPDADGEKEKEGQGNVFSMHL